MSSGFKRNKLVVCADGFAMSVQASETNYCDPRVNNAERYISVEVGFPTLSEDLLLDFAEDREKPTDTVYGWVPSHIVGLVIAKHGGMVSGEVPPGVPPLMAT